MHEVRAALLAGGLGERLGPLAEHECKPLVPYAGMCRLSDFSVANTARSGIGQLLLLARHGERALIDHALRHWDRRGTVDVHFGPQDAVVRAARSADGGLADDCRLLPRPVEHGTADALLASAEWLFAPGARDVLILHADHVYVFDYAPMIRRHRDSGADVTIGVQRIERRFVPLFGMVDVGPGGEVRRLVEKPPQPTSDLIFTAFCLFRADVLERVLGSLAQSGQDGWEHDISRDVLPFMIENGYRVRAFPVRDYWADIGTVERYLLGHLMLVGSPPAIPLAAIPQTLPGAQPVWQEHDRVIVNGQLPARAQVRESVLYPGCVVEPGARVERCVLLPGARVAAGAKVSDTLVLGGETVTGDRRGLAGLKPTGGRRLQPANGRGGSW